MPGQLFYLDKVIGVLLGLVLASLFMGVFSVLLWNLVVVKEFGKVNLPIARWLNGSVQSSFLLGYFSDFVLPYIYSYARPILPPQVDIIFVVGQ